MTSFVSLFAGAGGSAQGAKQAGLTPVGAVEWNGNLKIGGPDAIAQIYAANHGAHVIAEPVECVDYKQWAGITMGQASPACTRFSVANTGGRESELDIKSAHAVARFLRDARPKLFVLENVTQYAGSDSLGIITNALAALGYSWQADNLNSADYGVPQTRRRLIVRAVLNGPVPPIYPTHCDRKKHAAQEGNLFAAPLLPWNGWYDAIEWLIPTLPDSQLAEWQKKRMPPELLRSLLVGGANTSDVQAAPGVGVSWREQPSRCVATNAVQWRAVLMENISTIRPATLGASQEPCHSLTAAQCGRRQGNMPTALLCGVQGEGGDLYRDGVPPSPTITSAHAASKYRAVLIEGDAAGDRPPTCGTSAEPCFTLKTPSGGRVHRALLVHPTADNEWFPVVPADDPAFTVTCFRGKPRAVLVDGCNGDTETGCPTLRVGQEPAFTVTASPKGTHRAILENYRVVSLTVEALAALQSFPHDYQWPTKRSLAAVGIGNAVPPGLMDAVCKSLLEAL